METLETEKADPASSTQWWPLVFILLSLDVVRPFFDLMGLEIPDPQRFVDLVRREIVRVRYLYARPDPIPYDATETLASIETTFGTRVRAGLQWWMDRIFAPGWDGHRPLRLWMDVLRWARDDDGRLAAIGWPKTHLSAVRSQIERAFDRGEHDRRYIEVYSHPLSDWDLHMYAVNLFDDEDPGAPNGPDSYVYQIIMDVQAYRFWAWALATFDAATMKKVHERSNEITATEPDLKYIGTLVPPATLDIGVTA